MVNIMTTNGDVQEDIPRDSLAFLLVQLLSELVPSRTPRPAMSSPSDTNVVFP